MASEQPSTPGFVLYQSPDGGSRLSVRLEGKTVWLTQAQMAELFQIGVGTVNHHLGELYAEGELAREATTRSYRIVRTEGSREVARDIEHYALPAILAVGYRVRSGRGTQFRQWATATLGEYLTKGFALDDQRLKDVKGFGKDYFDELLARIRDIRASERRFYQKVTDIYSTSIDYDKDAALTREFYATVQNKLHWAIHGRTAAEVVKARADAGKLNMGLTTWKNAPGGPVRKDDVTVAKNYLTADEINALNRVVTMYLDYAEDQAANQRTMHMADWVKKLDGFLRFNERNILTHAGKVSQAMAQEHAEKQFARYEQERLARLAAEPSSDFDRIVEDVKRLGKSSSSRRVPPLAPPTSPASPTPHAPSKREKKKPRKRRGDA